MAAIHERPNILLIMADQLSALATSPYGNNDAQTPNMQALADRGVTFQSTYCNSPLCVPSRASMVSGQHCSRIGSYDNGSELLATTPTFMHHLRLGGYQTILSGKMHFIGPDQLHGFEHRLTTDIYPAGYDLFRPWDSLGNPPRPPSPKMAMELKRAGPVSWSEQLEYDEEVHYRTMEQLRVLGRRHEAAVAEQPWLLCASYTHPHDPPLVTQEYWDRYDGVDLTMPKEPPPGYEPHLSDTWVKTYCGIDQANLTREEVYRARRGYYGMTSYFDDKVGALVREVERFGMLDNTIVIVTSDHGDMVGEHGMWFKRSMREWSSRVPLIVSAPGRYPSGGRVTQNVSLVDLYPSLLAMAGIEIPPDLPLELDGHDVTPLIRGDVSDWSNEVIIENYNGTIKPIRAIVKDRYKYVYTHDLEPQLFDLAEDPDEWTNLARDPAYASIAEDLRQRVLDGWDGAVMERRIIDAQRVCMFVRQALAVGTPRSWDYQPLVDASTSYTRPAKGGRR